MDHGEEHQLPDQFKGDVRMALEEAQRILSTSEYAALFSEIADMWLQDRNVSSEDLLQHIKLRIQQSKSGLN